MFIASKSKHDATPSPSVPKSGKMQISDLYFDKIPNSKLPIEPSHTERSNNQLPTCSDTVSNKTNLTAMLKSHVLSDDKTKLISEEKRMKQIM